MSAPHFCTSCGQPAGAVRFCGHCGNQLGLDPGATTEVLPRIPAQSTGPAVSAEADDGESLPPDDADTLEGLPWQEEPDPLPGPGRRRPTRRQGIAAAAAFALVAALAGAGMAGARYLADGDLREALASSSRDFNRVVNALSTATSPEEIASAAGQTATSVEGLDAALGKLGSASSPRESAARTQLEAEKALLTAISRLAGLASEPLKTWGAAHDELTAAKEAEATSRAAFARFHSEAARELADTGLMLTKVTTAVGVALVGDATEASSRLLTSLAAAKTTADLRKLGDAAAPEQAAVAAAARALPAGDGKQVLSGYAAALAALADLSTISGESAGSWSTTRAELAQTFGQLAASAGSTGGANVRVVLDGALKAADDVVSAAVAAIVDWKAKTEAAIKARTTDAEALDRYAGFFRTQAKTYEQLRMDLSGFTKRVEESGATYYEAYAFLSQAAQDRRDVRDLLVSTDVPTAVAPAHQDVISAIDRAISAVRSAYDGLEQSQDCYDDCPYYLDTPGWQRFLSESDGISKSYSSAMTTWEAAVAKTRVAISDRPLPTKPAV